MRGREVVGEIIVISILILNTVTMRHVGLFSW